VWIFCFRLILSDNHIGSKKLNSLGKYRTIYISRIVPMPSQRLYLSDTCLTNMYIYFCIWRFPKKNIRLCPENMSEFAFEKINRTILRRFKLNAGGWNEQHKMGYTLTRRRRSTKRTAENSEQNKACLDGHRLTCIRSTFVGRLRDNN
jgi:hypothetical protein